MLKKGIENKLQLQLVLDKTMTTIKQVGSKFHVVLSKEDVKAYARQSIKEWMAKHGAEEQQSTQEWLNSSEFDCF